MRSNAMKMCATGVMLCSGTLGLSQSASAGLTWSANSNGSWGDFPSIYLNLVSGGNARPTQELTSLTSPFTLTRDPSDPLQNVVGNASMNFSGLTSSGPNANSWSISGFVPSDTPTVTAMTYGYLWCQVTGLGGQQISVTLAAGGSLDIANQDGDLVKAFSGGNSESFLLSEGIYFMQFYASSAVGSSFSGELVNFTVPAPGAVALVGLVGLVGGRRRRA
jgi:MYXO-CTERM domain-containing protein